MKGDERKKILYYCTVKQRKNTNSVGESMKNLNIDKEGLLAKYGVPLIITFFNETYILYVLKDL